MNIGLDISDDELLEIKEKFCKESTQSFFENGLYAETTQIRDTASELKGNAKDKMHKNHIVITYFSFLFSHYITK